MDTDTLKEMFDPMNEAQNMTYSDVINGISEMRASEPDSIDMTDEEIANAIYRK
jgi:hypothetical protein